MSGKVFVFAGTTEGREIAVFLGNKKIETVVFVATDYGETLIDDTQGVEVVKGRLSQEEMMKVISDERPCVVIDATHPFAVLVSQNLKKACSSAKVKYLRILRANENIKNKNTIYVEKIEDALNYINETEGNVLLTTGSKEIEVFKAVKKFQDRLYVRILPFEDGIKKCKDIGILAQNIICMQGPFSKTMNEEILKFSKAEYLVTKESGKEGGFVEKMQACESLGVKAIVIGRKEEIGVSIEAAKKEILDIFDIQPTKKVYVVGAGMGTWETITLEGQKAIRKSQLIITTKRILDGLGLADKKHVLEYSGDKIKEIINSAKEENIVVIFSGDIGFFSGAKGLADTDFEYISGMSSMAYFMNRLKKNYENVKQISLHGRDNSFITAVHRSEKTFLLLGGVNNIGVVSKKLTEYGLGDLNISIGKNLGSIDEKICKGKAKDFVGEDDAGLSVMLVENHNPKIFYGFLDNAFIRRDVPMTKEEVRRVSISKLQLGQNSITYDIGAGTGSVSLEIAEIALKVYAIEKEDKAVELIKENAVNLKCDNISIIKGTAPNCFEELPVPDSVFVGGSSGNMAEILDWVLLKNPCVKVVINLISLDTLATVTKYLANKNIENYEIVNLTVSRSKKIGRHDIMQGQNPVYIVSFGGNEVM